MCLETFLSDYEASDKKRRRNNVEIKGPRTSFYTLHHDRDEEEALFVLRLSAIRSFALPFLPPGFTKGVHSLFSWATLVLHILMSFSPIISIQVVPQLTFRCCDNTTPAFNLLFVKSGCVCRFCWSPCENYSGYRNFIDSMKDYGGCHLWLLVVWVGGNEREKRERRDASMWEQREMNE